MNDSKQGTDGNDLQEAQDAAQSEFNNAALAVAKALAENPRKETILRRLVEAYREVMKHVAASAFVDGVIEGRRQALTESDAPTGMPEAYALSPESTSRIKRALSAAVLSAIARDALRAASKD